MAPAPETKSLLTAVNDPDGANGNVANAPTTPPRTASGAVKAMGLSLSSITREAEEARVLRQALEDGERVVSLDTALVATSFISDRLGDEDRDDDDFATLVESIREGGQHAPILVRPHPEKPDHFQVAYGHRRLRAARRLGQPVKALVRPLSDDELVLAQGKENAERRNLSFIERALFARALSDRGFDQDRRRGARGSEERIVTTDAGRRGGAGTVHPRHRSRAQGGPRALDGAGSMLRQWRGGDQGG